METSGHRLIDTHINKGKSLEQLSPTEQKQFVEQTIAERDKFVTWVKNNKVTNSSNPVFDSIKNSPSQKALAAAISAVGLFNLGIPFAAKQHGIQTDVPHLWRTDFGSPVIEELVFRSKKIPHFISWAGEKVGITIPDNMTRVGSAVTFGLAHAPKYIAEHRSAKDIYRTTVRRFSDGLFFNKLSEDYGLGTSTAAHMLINATQLGFDYASLAMPNNKNAIRALSLTQLGMSFVFGIVGATELVKDFQINNILQKVRTADPDNPILPEHINKTAIKLLSTPSTDGYKFQAGVELAYVNAALTMPDMLKDVMTPDEYARTQVHKMVTDVWRNPKTLPHRLEKANRYITEQIAARKSTS